MKVGSGAAGRLRPGDLARRASTGCWRAVERAVARGARVLTGGRRVDALAPGYYMAPTVLENVPHDDELSQQELFGPVTCLYRVAGFRRSGAAGQRDRVRADRRDSHRQQQSHRAVHQRAIAPDSCRSTARRTAPARTCRLAA